MLLRELYKAGVRFDCASERELLEVQKLAGLETPMKDNILYANPCKSGRDLAAAKEVGSPVTVVDSVEEVQKLSELAYTGGALVRIAVDDSSSAMPFSTKFGCSPGLVGIIAKEAQRLGIPLKGVSFHVGSGCGGDGAAYRGAIYAAYHSLLTMKACGHAEAATIDLGGGFLPEATDFRRKAATIRGAMEDLTGTRAGPIQWVAEPGRYFATNAFDLFVQVIGKKSATEGYKYTIDESLYGQFSGILFDYAAPQWYRVKAATGSEPKRGRSKGVIFGRTCDSVDVIARAEEMEELEVGDWLWFPQMGAYARATASEFNGFPTPPVIVADESFALEESEADPPKIVRRMPPVSARAFWEATRS